MSSPFSFQIVPWKDFSLGQKQTWEQWRSHQPALRSPFFSVDFSDVVASSGRNVDVLVGISGHQEVAYWPIEFCENRRAVPVGGLFNDEHGMVVAPDCPLRYSDVLSAGILDRYTYHAMSGSVSSVSFDFETHTSFLADLDAPPQGYVPFLEESRNTILKQKRKTKKMVRDLGPLRLVFDERSPSVFEQAIAWKRAQYQRTYLFDILSVDWATSMLRRFWEESHRDCRGLLSALYAGPTLVAVHFGLLERDWLHYWFPSYDSQYHAYSPGTALFLEIARQSQTHGLRFIDMGYGEPEYKQKLTNRVRSVSQGILTASASQWHYHQCRHHARIALKSIPLKQTCKRLLRSVFPSWGQSKYQ